MNLAFTPEQLAVRDLARQIFDGMCTDARLRELEAAGEAVDTALWAELERSGLLNIASAEGMVAASLLLEEAGRAAARIPLAEHVGIDTDRARVAYAALLTGACDGAVRLTATYTSDREQFERPIATFQAVQQRIADAYIDVEVMRWSMLHAAWCIDAGEPATEAATIAKYWASRGAQQVLAAAQHLHGGMGVDMDYPLHRYVTIAKRAELALGGAWQQLAAIGEMIT
jgi:3-oxocholest-4-en-26-oyl-CoA dehydrogenase beta subunit